MIGQAVSSVSPTSVAAMCFETPAGRLSSPAADSVGNRPGTREPERHQMASRWDACRTRHTGNVRRYLSYRSLC